MADRLTELLAEEQQLRIRTKQLREEIDAEMRRIHQEAAGSLGRRFTQREQEILPLIRQRLTNKEIAAKLNVGTRTIGFHISSMLAKMNVKSRHDL
jgi:DNA-binding NarL/FixJ family response regulator